jgi:lysophospholipase
MIDFDFLGEDDFPGAMAKENKAFRETCVEQGTISAPDGTGLNYYIAAPKDPKASLLIVHGMGEFFGKYHEYIWNMYRAGFKVFFMENRGHGYSEGKAPEHDVIYIDSYDTYVEDLKTFIDRVVLPQSEGLQKLMIAHSMGGCIGALFLEKYPGIFKAAILSSPMLKMKGADYSPFVVALLKCFALVTGKRKKLAPNQKHFDPNTDFAKSSALSRARFDYQLSQRIADEHYQTTGASFSWALSSLDATRKVIAGADKLKLPITVMTAGKDHLIDAAGYEQFKTRVPQAVFHAYDNSRHEIFNSDDESRKRYFADVIDTLDSYLD